MVDGGVDAVLVETAQDLLQAKAAIIGAKRALAGAPGVDLPLFAKVTVETTGTHAARHRDRRRADRARAARHRPASASTAPPARPR